MGVLELFMIPESTAERIFEAMGRFDRELRGSADWVKWEQKESHKYAIKHHDALYPVKKIVSIATDTPVNDFSGGDEANGFVEKLGFNIVRLHSEEHPKNSPTVWIEKTIVKGRADREQGEHRLGAALWSPQRARNGADIYSNMRAVQPGDVVLHLIDNKQFSGVSLAAGAADDTFQGLPNTAWEGPAYRIPLAEYLSLDPPLTREDFFESPEAAAELRKVHEQYRGRGLFYTGDLDLNQGKYLTVAPPELVGALKRIYTKLYGKDIPHLGAGEAPAAVTQYKELYTVDDAMLGIFLERAEFEEMLLLLGTKKNIVLQGPPGVGKTFIARRLAYALLNAEDRTRVRFVQFHQSYSYECQRRNNTTAVSPGL